MIYIDVTEKDHFKDDCYKCEKNEVPTQSANGSTVPLVDSRKNDPEMGEYDPFQHRKLEHPTSDMDTLIHLLKGSLGSGVLAMPLAFSHAGLFFGLICTFLIGIICTYCVHILVKSAHELSRRSRVPSLGFAEVAEAAFLSGPPSVQQWAKFAKAMINMFLVIDLLGCCCVYIVFVAKKYSTVATGMGITFYYIFSDLPSIDSQPAFAGFSNLPAFFGTAIFALEGVLNTGMSFVVLLYATTGFFGYLKYGEDTKLGSITLNLPKDEPLAQSVKIMIAVAVFFTYALQFYVPMEIIWKAVKNNFGSKKTWAEYGIRISLVVLTVILAILIPNLGGFISLVGAVCLSMLGLIFPAIIDLVTFYDEPRSGKINWRLWKNVFLICFGLIGFATGTYVSIIDIIHG
ncbi:hypothetical protein NQ317_016645 [Molorchus minor]|uniref:Amino acid transporter transmembrane domain-containing protein n=1 Tax=Molorchus minor TaxID=1323400 RepID=A0ABQ9J6A7_9CUCU|nr:hypothetical protein NQ317_016645 [Molorchus minor]